MVKCKHINERAVEIIKFAWDSFCKKVGGGAIQVNKEASMQLHFAHILQQVMPLITYHKDEYIEIDLETAIFDGEKTREVDIMMTVFKGEYKFRIAIELKCYREIAASGGKRGATDIFMKDVYQDLDLIEKYCNGNEADYGIVLVMTDLKNFINPKSKDAKCWDYDISNGTIVQPGHYTTPIGGKEIDIRINNQYEFNWKEEGMFYFVLLERMR